MIYGSRSYCTARDFYAANKTHLWPRLPKNWIIWRRRLTLSEIYRQQHLGGKFYFDQAP
jgi:hypothetical protein